MHAVHDPTLPLQDEIAKRLLARAAQLREQPAEEDESRCGPEPTEAASADADA